MTWLKLSDDFSEECQEAGLSDAAFRTHVEGLLWTMRRESAGRITFRDVDRFADSADVGQAVPELVRVGFWSATASGYVIEHHMEHQPEPEIMEQRRKMDAERQRRARFKRAKLESSDLDVSRRDSRRDNTRDPGRGGSGRDGKPPITRSADKKEENGAAETEDDWPETAEPGSGATPQPDTRWADRHYDNE